MKLNDTKKAAPIIYRYNIREIPKLRIVVLLSLLMILMNNCNDSNNKEKNNEKELSISDSIPKSFITSEVADENTAYKNIKFGISKSEYNSIKESDTIIINASDKYLVKPLFNKKDQLIKLNFEGIATYSSWFNDNEHLCVKQLSNFYDKLKEKYGESKILKSFRVDYIDDSWANVWDIGIKKILLGIRIENGPKYKVICSITNTPAENDYLKEVENDQKQKAIRNKDSVVKNNPF